MKNIFKIDFFAKKQKEEPKKQQPDKPQTQKPIIENFNDLLDFDFPKNKVK